MPALTVVLLLFAGCASAPPEPPAASSHAMVFEMDASGRITPYSYYLRKRDREPVPEIEVRAVMARQQNDPPTREGYVAVRAHDRWGAVIFTTLVKVALEGHTLCCPHQDFSIEKPVLSVIVPSNARSVSFEGWKRTMSVSYDIAEVIAAHRRHGGGD